MLTVSTNLFLSAQFVGGWGFKWKLVPLNPQVFIDPHNFSQKYIADPPLVLPQIEYCLFFYIRCTFSCTRLDVPFSKIFWILRYIWNGFEWSLDHFNYRRINFIVQMLEMNFAQMPNAQSVVTLNQPIQVHIHSRVFINSRILARTHNLWFLLIGSNKFVVSTFIFS